MKLSPAAVLADLRRRKTPLIAVSIYDLLLGAVEKVRGTRIGPFADRLFLLRVRRYR